MIARKPIPKKRATPRSRRCAGCLGRTVARKCATCGTLATTKRGNIGKRCDELWAKWIKRSGKCFRCGATEGLQAAHIIGRAQRVVRWNLDNGICLDWNCHRMFDSHKIDRQDLILEAIGPARYAALIKKAQGVWDKHYPLEELTKLVKEMKA